MSWAEELLAPDYRIENVSTAVTDRTYYGVNGVREWLGRLLRGAGRGRDL